jgi:hypothetical protein
MLSPKMARFVSLSLPTVINTYFYQRRLICCGKGSQLLLGAGSCTARSEITVRCIPDCLNDYNFYNIIKFSSIAPEHITQPRRPRAAGGLDVPFDIYCFCNDTVISWDCIALDFVITGKE